MWGLARCVRARPYAPVKRLQNLTCSLTFPRLDDVAFVSTPALHDRNLLHPIYRQQQPQGAQFTVASPQHRLNFFPDPHGHGSFRPTLEALRRGSLVWAPGLTCLCDRK
jgi:hypothetical protein